MRLIRSDAFEIFKSRGVPVSVLLASFPENIDKHISIIEVPKNEGNQILDKAQQRKDTARFEKVIQSGKTTSKPFLCAAGRSYDFIPSQYALQIAANLVEHSGSGFYWHVVNGSPQDPLRDNAEFRDKIGSIKLLIISGLAENSTAMKLEKTRDLLTQYSNVARILVVGGSDPVAFTKNHLHVKPDLFVYL